MKATIYLNSAQMEMCKNAMRGYRSFFKSSAKRLFDLAYDKVMNEEDLDSMELIYLVRALRRRAKLLMANYKRQESKHYNQLADHIEQTIRDFQMENHPLKRKEAQTAGTVYAS